VYDGATFLIPAQMGTPRDDQLQGEALERLSELAGRICYDSLGQGRSSDGFHAHIQSVRHLSVYEHCPFTVCFATVPDGRADWPVDMLFRSFANRPGVWIRVDGAGALRVTLNPRAVIEWDEWTERGWGEDPLNLYFRNTLRGLLQMLMPRVRLEDFSEPPGRIPLSASIIDPGTPDEQWVSLFVSGSRGFSHEQVRHGDFTAISQRSTRYVDESASPWVEHPLLTLYREETGTDLRECWPHPDDDRSVPVEECGQGAYLRAVDLLHPWLEERGVDRLTARKQARGAARGFLGNALYTEMIFSANVRQWRNMLRQRCSEAADAEIRALYAQVLPALWGSRYGERFDDFVLVESPDGIGQIMVERRALEPGQEKIERSPQEASDGE